MVFVTNGCLKDIEKQLTNDDNRQSILGEGGVGGGVCPVVVLLFFLFPTRFLSTSTYPKSS